MSAVFGCTLTVAAASDLAPLQQPLAGAVPGCTLRFTFGSSGMLSQQIRHGAEFDVFLSANERYVDELVKGKAAHSKVVYAEGRVAIWSKKNLGLKDLASVRTLAMANPAHAPYGQAAKEALDHQQLWQGVQSRVVYAENVRQAVQFAETGNADIAIVAWSLVKDRGGKILPAEWHKPILQSAAIPVRSRNAEAAKKLLTFLLSPSGQTVLARSGFFPARTAPRSQSAYPAQ